MTTKNKEKGFGLPLEKEEGRYIAYDGRTSYDQAYYDRWIKPGIEKKQKEEETLLVAKNKMDIVQFNLHQCYEAPGTTVLYRCEKCNHHEFYIGTGNYFTVAKCKKCDHEECVHDG